MLKKKWTLLLYLIILASLACVTNTPLAQVPTPRPTRTAVATFTHTPLPPTATIVTTVEPTATPSGDTATPMVADAPVESSVPPTDTPDTTVRITITQGINVRAGPGTAYDTLGSATVGSTSIAMGRNADGSWLQIEYPENSGARGWVFTELIEVSGPQETLPIVNVDAPPTATPLPPTATPVPTATPIPPTATPLPASNSPLAPPTNTPQPGTPGGRYEALETEGENNCSDMGVVGWVKDKGNDQPIANVIVEVREDDGGGTFTGVSDASGNYSIFIGPIDDVGSKTFEAKVVGDPAVTSEDTVEWSTSRDCHDGNAIQVMRINWGYKN